MYRTMIAQHELLIQAFLSKVPALRLDDMDFWDYGSLRICRTRNPLMFPTISVAIG